MKKMDVTILHINKKNLNNHIYNEDAVKNMIDKINNNTVYGGVGMCNSRNLDLSKVSHVVTNLRIEGDRMVGTISIRDDKNGQRLKEMMANTDVVFRVQGEGCCNNGEISNFKLLSINAIDKYEDAFELR